MIETKSTQVIFRIEPDLKKAFMKKYNRNAWDVLRKYMEKKVKQPKKQS